MFPDVSMQNIVKIFPSWETELSTEPAGISDSNAHRFFIYIKWCKNVLLKGFTAVDGPSWHVVPAACDHVVIDDMNIMSRIVTGD